MATGRDYLQSILAQVAQLQNKSDETLDSIKDGLERLDDELCQALDYVNEKRDQGE